MPYTVAMGLALGILIAPHAAPIILGAVGFGPVGPVAGGVAAGFQAGVGNVAAGSLFAGLQSVAMGGPFPVIGHIIGGVVAAVAVAGADLLRRFVRDTIRALQQEHRHNPLFDN